MNSSHPTATSVGLPHDGFAFPRFRVCRLSTAGEINRRITATDSAEIAVLDFLNVATLRRADNLYVWDREKRIVAEVEWIDESTTFGSTVKIRTNQFYDVAFADIARCLCQRNGIHHAIVQGVAI